MSPAPHRLLAIILLAGAITAAGPGCSRKTPAQPASHDFRAEVSLSTNAIRVGDVLTLELRIDHPEGGRLSVPDPGRDKDIVIRHRDSRTETLDNQWVRTVATFVLTSFTVGEHSLPTGTVTYTSGDATPLSTPFPAASFSVLSVLAPTNSEPRDIKGLVSWPGVFPRWLSGLLLVAALAVAAALAVRHFLLKPRTILQYPPEAPPHETALRRLRELLTRGWIESAQAEAFYVELSSIVRQYIEDRFALRAPERTTEEFIREAANSRLLSTTHQQLVAGFLEQSDLVKFARFAPAPDAMRAAFQAGERLVRETAPPPEVTA